MSIILIHFLHYQRTNKKIIKNDHLSSPLKIVTKRKNAIFLMSFLVFMCIIFWPAQQALAQEENIGGYEKIVIALKKRKQYLKIAQNLNLEGLASSLKMFPEDFVKHMLQVAESLFTTVYENREVIERPGRIPRYHPTPLLNMREPIHHPFWWRSDAVKILYKTKDLEPYGSWVSDKVVSLNELEESWKLKRMVKGLNLIKNPQETILKVTNVRRVLPEFLVGTLKKRISLSTGIEILIIGGKIVAPNIFGPAAIIFYTCMNVSTVFGKSES